MNYDVCAVLPGFDSFRTFSCDEAKNLINRLPNKSRDLDLIPATCLKQFVDQLTAVIKKIIDLSMC